VIQEPFGDPILKWIFPSFSGADFLKRGFCESGDRDEVGNPGRTGVGSRRRFSGKLAEVGNLGHGVGSRRRVGGRRRACRKSLYI